MTRFAQQTPTRRKVLLSGFAAAAIAIPLSVEAQSQRVIKVGLPSDALGPAAMRVMEEMGLFAKHGLKAEFSILGSGNGAMTGLIAGAVELVQTGPSDMMAARARGQDVVAIANGYVGFVGSLILAKSVADKLGVSPNASIEQRLKALDGLIIASPSATSIVTSTIGSAARDTKAVPRFTYMQQTAMPAALVSGAIQGYGAASPFWVPPVLNGDAVLWINGPKGEFPADKVTPVSSQIQTMRRFAEANPAVIKSIVAAHAEFVRAIDERPAEVRAAVGKLFSNLDAKILDYVFPSESQAWKAKPMEVSDLRKEIELMKASGMPLNDIDKLDLSKAFYPGP
jgi:ABC-type nitrate/sulfonate/bicarbonate transport system substrate-binding protein